MSDSSRPAEGPGPDAHESTQTGGERDQCGAQVAGESAELDIAQLVRAYHQSVFRYAYRLVGAVPDAEDLTQQTFLIAQQKIDQIREPEKADRWLFAVLRSCFLKNRRRRRPTSAANLDLDIDNVAVDPPKSSDVDAELLQLVLSEMADQHRLILVMFYFEELSYKEIAKELEVPIGTVMSRLARAKSRLRELLTQRGT